MKHWNPASAAKCWRKPVSEIITEGIAEVFERIMPDAEGRAEYHYVLSIISAVSLAAHLARATIAALSDGLRYRSCPACF